MDIGHGHKDAGVCVGVGEAVVVGGQVLVVGDEVVAKPLLAPAVKIGQLAGGCHLDVYIVWGAAEHPVVEVGDDL